MNTKQQIDLLWKQFRESINKVYAQANERSRSGAAHDPDNPVACLHDYAENISWNDSLARLLGQETANERRHRSTRPSVPGFSVESAAKLILMRQASDGSCLEEMPKATEFLVFRQSVAEARLIGFLAQEFVKGEWRIAVDLLDYAELMKVGQQ